MKAWTLVVVIVALVLTVPPLAEAKTARAHKVSGTVSSIQGNNVMVKEADGTTVTVMLDAKTQFTRGKAASERSALKVGEHIVAHGTKEKSGIMATTVKISKSAKK
jgi:F0F1-type ATP synthase membrane subunit b/b'